MDKIIASSSGITGDYDTVILKEKIKAAEARTAELERENELYKAGAEKLEEMIEQFHNGEAAYELGRAIDEKPVGDLFRIGYAWAAFYDLSNAANVSQESISIAAKYKQRAAELERVLRMYPEWLIYGTWDTPRCPVCKGKQYYGGHAPDCPRQKVLNEGVSDETKT